MRSHLLTSAAMLMALLATAPAMAEEEAANTQTMDAGMAEAAAEHEAMEAAAEQEAMEAEAEPQVMANGAEAVTEQSETAEYIPPVEHGVTPAGMKAKTVVETTEREEVTGTVMEMSGPAALPPPDTNIPARGMHMNQVEQMYGKPMGINPPVGEPPITRWVYPGFAVYFEYSYVIQSVPK